MKPLIHSHTTGHCLQFLGLPDFYSEMDMFLKNYKPFIGSSQSWTPSIYLCSTFVLLSLARRVCVFADIEQCERTDTWIQANCDSRRSRSRVRTGQLRSLPLGRARRTHVLFSFFASSLPSAAMSRTFLAIFLYLAVLPTVVIPARYVPKWKKQVSSLLSLRSVVVSHTFPYSYFDSY